MEGFSLLKDYLFHKDRYLPMFERMKTIPPQEYSCLGKETNIGWYAGMMDEKRPFYAELWAVDGFHLLSIFVSTKGIEDITAEELDLWFQKIGFYRRINNKYGPEIQICHNRGNEFFSMSVGLGVVDEEESSVDDFKIFPFSILNLFIQTFEPIRGE